MCFIFFNVTINMVYSTVKHSVEYLATASSGIPNIPEFMVALVLDGIQMGYCDSTNKVAEPRQDYVKKMLENDTELLEMYTRQCTVIRPQTFGNRISSLKKQVQQSGGAVSILVIYLCSLTTCGFVFYLSSLSSTSLFILFCHASHKCSPLVILWLYIWPLSPSVHCCIVLTSRLFCEFIL